MRPAIFYPDAQLATRNVLRRLLETRPEPDAQAATVSTRDAPTDDATTNPRPWVKVAADASSRGPASATATVRILVYTGTDVGRSIALAALIEALCLAEASSDDIRSLGPITGPVATTDPDTGEPMAAVTLSARLRPRHL